MKNVTPVVAKPQTKRFAIAAVATSALLGVSNAFALKAADITTATTAAGADESINTAALWVLGIAVVIFAGRKVISFFGRG